MSINNSATTLPLKLSEFASFFGVSNKLSSVCTTAKINKWALWKPISYKKDTALTYDERIAAHNGFTAQQLNVSFVLNKYSNITPTTWASSLPTGTVNSPYRLSDFYDCIANTGGYNHGALPPDSEWRGIDIEGNVFNVGTASGTVSINNNVVSLPTNKSIAYQNFSCKFGIASAASIGSTDSRNLPLPVCATLATDARIGLIVDMTFDSTHSWMLAVSTKPLSTFSTTTDVQYMIPNFFTNPYLCQRIYTEYSKTTSPLRDVYFIPVIVSGLSTNTATYNSKNYTYLSASNVYSFPSGQGRIKLHLLSDDIQLGGLPTPNPKQYLSGVGYVGIYAEDTGSTIQSGSTQIPVRSLKLAVYQTELTRMKADTTIKVTYTYTAYNQSANTTTATHTIKLSSLTGKDSATIATLVTQPAASCTAINVVKS